MTTVKPIPLDLIREPTTPLRSDIDDEAIQDLARSMAAHGMLNPITVTQDDHGYHIIAGHRRYLAARWLNWSEIPATVLPKPPTDPTAVALVENIQREEMNPDDEATAILTLTERHHLSPKEIARRLGKSLGWVGTRLELARLPEDLRDAVRTHALGIGVALALAQITDRGWREYYTRGAIQEGATLQTVNYWIAQWRDHTQRQEAAGLPTTAPSTWEPPPEPHFPCWACQEPKAVSTLIPRYVCLDCLAHLETATEAPQQEDNHARQPGRGTRQTHRHGPRD